MDVTAAADALRAPATELRAELAADLARGGYVFGDSVSATSGTPYFDKYLLLVRPGLLARSARLLAPLLPKPCDRLAVTGIASAVLGSAVAQETGIPLLIGQDRGDDVMRFGGEPFSLMRVVLLEDVVFTGRRAATGVAALADAGASVLAVVCLLDREVGAAQRLSESGCALRALFTESQLAAEARPQ